MKLLILVVVLFKVTSVYAQDSVVVYGSIKNTKIDTLKFVLNENTVVRQARTYYTTQVNGKFRLAFPLSKPSYFYLKEGETYINGIVAPGDNIGISYDAADYKSTLVLSGKAKEKFIWASTWTGARLTQQIRDQSKIAKDKPYPFDHVFNFFDSARDDLIQRLYQIQHLDSATAHMVKSQVEGSIQLYKYSAATTIYQEHISQTLETRSAQLTPASKAAIVNFLQFQEAYHNSPLYINAIYNLLYRHYEELTFTNKMNKDLITKYHYLDSLLPGKLKVPVLTMMLEDDIRKANPAEELQQMIEYVFAYSGDPIYSEYIQGQMARTHLFKKGSKAPGFSLENERGEKVSLASFKGKVVYMDFWFSSCAPCHSLFTMIKPVKEHFKGNKDVVFLIVSIDDKDLWKKSLKQFKIPGYHAYTENRERRHPIIADYKIAGYPTTFIIDKNGNIFLASPSGQPDELQKQITEALALQQ